MLRRLVIHRFQGIRFGEVNNIGKVNFLIGPNGSGKTAILELLYMSSLCRRPCKVVFGQDEKGLEATTLLPHDFLGYRPMSRLRQQRGRPASWENNPAFLTRRGDIVVTLTALPEDHPLRTFRLSGGFSEQDVEEVSLFSLSATETLPAKLVPDHMRRYHIASGNQQWYYLWESDWVHRFEKVDPLDNVAIWITDGLRPNVAGAFFCDPYVLTTHLPSSFTQWAKSNIAGWADAISRHLSAVFPILEGAPVEVGDEIYIRLRGGLMVTVDSYDGGVRHAAKVISALTALAKTVRDDQVGLFLWESPELFMHPASLARLMKEVVHIVAGRPIQMFVATHSFDVLAWLCKYLSDQPEIPPDEFRTFGIFLRNGELRVHPYVGTAVETWLEFVGDPRFESVEEEEQLSPLAYIFRQREDI